MNKSLCPGQDTRFWRPQDIFDVVCSACGRNVEFFKDEARRRCTGCGRVIVNPRLSQGCAQWCEHAAKCLGFDPSALEQSTEESSLFDRLVAELKNLAPEGSPLFSQTIRSLELAQRQAASANSAAFEYRPLFIAAFLLPVVSQQNDRQLKDESRDLANRVMERAGVDDRTRERVLGLLADFDNAEALPSAELLFLREISSQAVDLKG